MARRSRKKVGVSLFPFLSILACVMGVLTLMITALALSQMDTASIATLFEFNQLENRINDTKADIRKTQASIDAKTRTAGIDQQELARLRAELERLLKDKKDLLKAKDKPPKPSVRVPKVDPNAHQKRLAEMLKELEEQNKQREELLAQMQTRLKRAEAPVIIQPSGSGVGLKPTFVECDATGVVIYEGKEPVRVHRKDLGSNEMYLSLLKRIAEQPRSTVIFLVRDDGMSSYWVAQKLAQANFARNGKLPVIGHGKLDLTLFQK